MRRAEVLFAGLGGQGIQLAGDILARACTLAGRHVSVLPSYGAEARGTLIRSEVVISDEDIVYPGVLEPNVFVAFSQEAYDHFQGSLSGQSLVFYDPASVTPATGNSLPTRQYAIPALEAASALGNAKAANMIMLGAVAASSDLISKKTLEEILSGGPPKRAGTSVAALRRGFDLASQQISS